MVTEIGQNIPYVVDVVQTSILIATPFGACHAPKVNPPVTVHYSTYTKRLFSVSLEACIHGQLHPRKQGCITDTIISTSVHTHYIAKSVKSVKKKKKSFDRTRRNGSDFFQNYLYHFVEYNG